MTSSQDEKDIPWLERWRKQNFSWEGLSKHPSWARRETRSLQDYLRHLDRDISDGELEARGTLIKCGRRGLYHVLFIPEEWTSIKKPVCAPEELANKKRSYWEKLESNAGLNAGFLGTISGVHMPEDVEQRLVEGFRVSFAWVRFKSELRNIPKDIPRTFNQCVFVERLFLKGVAKQPPPGATLKFRGCHMDGPVDVESL